MVGQQLAVMRSIGQLFGDGPVAGLDERALIERFAATGDEAAFAALVALHGPMVLSVCRRMLRDGHDVEDAFQATFLVLVRRARSIRDPGRLGPWLFGVARRVAMRAQAQRVGAGRIGTCRDRRRSRRGRPCGQQPGSRGTTCSRSSTRRSPGCRRGTARRWCSATWRAVHTPTPRTGSLVRSGRSRAGWRGAGRGCGADWPGAGWRRRPWPRSWPRAPVRRSPMRWSRRPSARRRPGRSRRLSPRWPATRRRAWSCPRAAGSPGRSCW